MEPSDLSYWRTLSFIKSLSKLPKKNIEIIITGHNEIKSSQLENIDEGIVIFFLGMAPNS